MTELTAALGVSRLGDAMGAVVRGLSGRAAAVSLALLAILAGAATYAWLAGFAPSAFNTRGWITGLLVAELVGYSGLYRPLYWRFMIALDILPCLLQLVGMA